MSKLIENLKPSALTNLSSQLFEETRVKNFSAASYTHINLQLLEQLGFNKNGSDPEISLALIAGNHSLSPLSAISTVYAGHQFGIYTSKLGDGRVHIIGDVAAPDGCLWELQLKGAGATPFSRGNNGRMSLAEAITEYLGSEAMAGLGIASSRGLAIINHSTDIDPNKIKANRPGNLPKQQSVFVRAAASHLRFGHFEHLHNQGEHTVLKTLADHVIENYYPALLTIDESTRYLQFLYTITQHTARLLAQWQSVGFVHSVMNTDNMSILGLTIDYGVYGFMESYDPDFSPNDNDDQHRYAFNQQVDVARWNCLALAESLIELLPGKRIPATLLRLYRKTCAAEYQSLMKRKLGLYENHPDDEELINHLLLLLQHHGKDYSRFFRDLSNGDNHFDQGIEASCKAWNEKINSWNKAYQQRLLIEKLTAKDRQKLMRASNPKYILRQKSLENVIQQAEQNADYRPLASLLEILQSPFEEHSNYQYLY